MPEEPDSPERRLSPAWIVVGALVLVIVGLALTQSGEADGPERPRAPAGPVEVRYEVIGTADGVDITIETPTGTAQQSGRAVPLRTDEGVGIRYDFTRGDFVYISAQNTGRVGWIKCRIVGSDGSVISENRSEGAFVIATCSGSAR